jgi:hypothetical protein
MPNGFEITTCYSYNLFTTLYNKCIRICARIWLICIIVMITTIYVYDHWCLLVVVTAAATACRQT